ncbi:carbamate kinase [Vampirovibrio sp.]|uniref:carbamate kinase n=1 Tax=Vampirovibrio sp. TaxID=2717857 RepID=UPI00359315A7
MESVLIAIGGNALYDKKSGNNLCPQMVRSVCQKIVQVYQSGYLPVITFGNGPQVGNLLDMAETSARLFETPVTLDTCVSWTQGEIGYWLTRELTRQLLEAGIEKPVMAVNTLVEVNPDDAAFQKPSKPVGRFINADEAQRLYDERGWIVGPDANRGYRRMVPSPKPLRILEAAPIRHLIDHEFLVLCCGGGGIPVYKKDGVFQGIEAVIDKDFTSCLLAKTLKIENLIICTEVENVCLNFGQPNQKALLRLSLAEAEQYQAEGHFGAGSMGPKVAAMIDYVRHGGKRAFITSLEKTVEALAGQAGTEIHAGS